MRARPLVAGLAAVAVIGGGVGAATLAGGGEGTATAPPSTAPTSTATVRRTDLVTREDLDGTIGYGTASGLPVARAGTVTGLPEPGTTIERGGTVAEVDGRPVPLIYGAKPLWRPLTVDDEGVDVTIVEENLAALGYGGSLTVDDTFTAATAAAVEEWQEDLGVTEDGTFRPDLVVVRPGPVRVASQAVELGAGSGGPVLQVTAVEQRITIALEADRQGEVAAGDDVVVALPDGTEAPGVVYGISAEVTPGDDQAGTGPTVEVVVVLDDPAAGAGLDEAPVDVSIVTSRADDVLAVPLQAVLALAEGGYAVERVEGVATELVAVDLGASADGLVEVTGEVAEGDEVVVPS